MNDALREMFYYQLRVHVFAARNLPAADANGTADPYVHTACVAAFICCAACHAVVSHVTPTMCYRYVVVRAGGKKEKTSIRRDTLNPEWYESKYFNLMLPRDLNLAPQVVVEIWDWDRFTSNEKMATLRTQLIPQFLVARDLVGQPEHLRRPTWYPVASTIAGGTMQGEILLSFELVPKNSDRDIPPVVPSIKVRVVVCVARVCIPALTTARTFSLRQPKMRTAYVDVLALGVRSLAPYNRLPIMKPKVAFQVGDTGKKGRLETVPSKKPNGANANFLQHLTFPVQLPLDKRYLPNVTVQCVDLRLGGLSKPIVGVSAISLVGKVPWMDDYVPPASQKVEEGPPDQEEEFASAVIVEVPEVVPTEQQLLDAGAASVTVKRTNMGEKALQGAHTAAASASNAVVSVTTGVVGAGVHIVGGIGSGLMNFGRSAFQGARKGGARGFVKGFGQGTCVWRCVCVCVCVCVCRCGCLCECVCVAVWPCDRVWCCVHVSL